MVFREDAKIDDQRRYIIRVHLLKENLILEHNFLVKKYYIDETQLSSLIYTSLIVKVLENIFESCETLIMT